MKRPVPQGVVGSPTAHESAVAHVTGGATFVDDLPLADGTLHAAPVLCPVARGRLRRIDATEALRLAGVRCLVTADDVPGDPVLHSAAHDEPVLPSAEVSYAGQVVALLVAESSGVAHHAASLVQVAVDEEPPVLTVDQALSAGSFVLPSVHLERGDADAAIADAPHVLHRRITTPPAEHYYLETQVAYALPQEQDGWLVHSSTQHPHEVQAQVAAALGVGMSAVRVVCRRMGGGFGGKESQAGNVAVWAAVAAHATGAPVKLRLRRREDMAITGKRHSFRHDVTVGYDDEGRVGGLRLTMAANCGHSADLSGPVTDRALFHLDNAYFLPALTVDSHRCRTNLPSATAFRGFGAPQGVLVTETVLSDIARALRLDPLDVRLRNLYDTPGDHSGRNTTPYGQVVEDNDGPALITTLERTSGYRRRRREIDTWNASSPRVLRGIALVPVKFGISFTATFLNQAGAVVDVYTDGTVAVSHGGTEMGQGLHTKVMQVVAGELGVPLDRVRIVATDTAVVPNASATAASSGTDLNGRAAQTAARQVRDRLAALVAGRDGCRPDEVVLRDGRVVSPARERTFEEVVAAAHAARVQLWSDGFYATPKIGYDPVTMTGRPFYYYAHGAACAEVELDTETGEHRVVAVDLLYDAGRSINPAVDVGQIEGAFVQGMGWLTTESVLWDERGRLLTRGASTYKIPTAHDLPARMTVSLWPAPNPEQTVGRSKAVGEPPLVLAISVLEALRDAVGAIAPDDRSPVLLDAPASAEALLAAVAARRGR